MGASWMLLLVALFTPVLADNPGWFGLSHPLLRSGPYLLHAYVSQMLIMGALGCFAVALWNRETPLRWHPALGLVLGLLGWTVVATLLSPSPASALLGFPSNSQGLLSRIVATAVLLLTVGLADRSTRIRTAARVLSLIGGAVSVASFLQIVGVSPLGLSAPLRWGRSFGTLTNPDMFGGFVMIVLFTSLGVALSETTRPWRIAMGTSAALCAIAGFSTYSRAAWIGMVVGAVAFALLTWKSKVGIHRQLALSIIVVGLVITAAVAARPADPGGATDIPHRLTSAVSTTDADSAARLEVWTTTLRAIARRPVQGYGPDTMVLATGPVRIAKTSIIGNPAVVMESAHNLPLQTTSELGMPGFMLWAAMLAVIAVSSYRTITTGPPGAGSCRIVLAGLWAACAAYLADSLFTPSSVVGTLFLFCVLGLLISPSATAQVLHSPSGRRWSAGLLTLVAATGIATAVPFLAADVYAASAVVTDAIGSDRISAGALAVALNPLNADYAFVNSSVLISEADSPSDPVRTRALFAAALSEAQRSVAIEPTNSRRRSFLADVMFVGARRVDKNLYDDALAEFGRAVMMSPGDLQTRYLYAQAVGPARARPLLEGILQLRPGSAEAATRLAALYAKSGDKEAAKRVLRDALDVCPTAEERQQLKSELAGTG